MALGAGLSSDYLFPKRKFTSLLALNLVVMIIEIPLLSFGFFKIRSDEKQMNTDLEMFILGALTDGYYFMFYMLGSLAIARTAYVCN